MQSASHQISSLTLKERVATQLLELVMSTCVKMVEMFRWVSQLTTDTWKEPKGKYFTQKDKVLVRKTTCKKINTVTHKASCSFSNSSSFLKQMLSCFPHSSVFGYAVKMAPSFFSHRQFFPGCIKKVWSQMVNGNVTQRQE